MLTLGAKGTFGESFWDYDRAFTHSDDHLLSLQPANGGRPDNVNFKYRTKRSAAGAGPTPNGPTRCSRAA